MTSLKEELDCDLPFQLKVRHYDGLILCNEEEEELAALLTAIFKSYVRIKDRKSNDVVVSPEVTTIHSEDFDETSPIYDKIDLAIKNSNYIFMLITDTFIKDRLFQFMSNSALEQNFQDPNRNQTIIPVFKNGKDRHELEIITYLRTLGCILLDDIFEGKEFGSLDIGSISNVSPKKSFILRIEKLFSNKFHIRKDRDRKREAKINQYLLEYHDKIKREKVRNEEINYCHNNIKITKKGGFSIKGSGLEGIVDKLNIIVEGADEDVSDWGCPFYVLVEDDKPDSNEVLKSETNIFSEVKGQISKEVVGASESECDINDHKRLRDKALSRSENCVKTKPVMKVLPFHQNIEPECHEQILPK